MDAKSDAHSGAHDIKHTKVALLGLASQIWPISNTPLPALTGSD
jgi:hypothetical protein